jgi:anaerobic ribonucleoside-triphosphate reductase activating protein
MLKNPLTDGLTLSGGEPFAQAEDCAEIAEAAKKAGLNVWIYTGYTFEELVVAGDGSAERNLLGLADVLVDGRFILAERTLEYPWRGSRNQRLIDVRRSLSEGRAAELPYPAEPINNLGGK